MNENDATFWQAEALRGEILDQLRTAVMIVDTQRQLRYINKSADRLLGQGNSLEIRNGQLSCYRPSDEDLLLKTLRTLSSSNGEMSCGPKSDGVFLKVRGRGNRRDFGLNCRTIRNQASTSFGEASFLALVSIFEIGPCVDIDPNFIASMYELTAAEARVGAAIASGMTAEEVASVHAVSISTVRTQLRSLFGKTGTTRQAELVSVLAGITVAKLGFANSNAIDC